MTNKPTLCKHCGNIIEYLDDFTVHNENGEWCALYDKGFNICEANPEGHFNHEPALREYTEAELAEINARARVAAQWGSKIRRRDRIAAWWRERWQVIAYAVTISSAVSFSVGMMLKAVQCYG